MFKNKKRDKAEKQPLLSKKEKLKKCLYGTALWEIVKFSLVYGSSRIAATTGTFVNMSILGQKSTDILAATGLIAPIQSIIFSGGTSFLLGVGITTGRDYEIAKSLSIEIDQCLSEFLKNKTKNIGATLRIDVDDPQFFVLLLDDEKFVSNLKFVSGLDLTNIQALQSSKIVIEKTDNELRKELEDKLKNKSIKTISETNLENILSLISKYRREKFNEISCQFWQGIAMSCFISVPSITLASTLKYSLPFFRQDVALSKIVQNYYYGFLLNIPLTYVYATQQQFILGTKKIWPIAVVVSLNAVQTSSLGYFLTDGVFSWRGLNEWGLPISYTLSTLTSIVLFALYMQFGTNLHVFKIISICIPMMNKRRSKELLNMLKIGGALGIQVTLELGANIVLALMTGSLSKQDLAAQQIVQNYYTWLAIVTISISHSGTLLISMARKGKKYDCYAKILGNTNVFLWGFTNLSGIYYSMLYNHLII